MTFAIHTFGCKVNLAESLDLVIKLIKLGHEVIPEFKQANLFNNNTIYQI